MVDRTAQFRQLLAFELGYYARRASTWVYFAGLAVLACLSMLGLAGAFSDASFSVSGASAAVYANSPFTVLMVSTVLGLFALFATAALAGHAGGRDVQTQSELLLYATPAPRKLLLAARFTGTLLINLFVYLGIPLGLWVGAQFPGLDPSVVGPDRLLAYIQPLVISLMPNLTLSAALFFGIAILTRRSGVNHIVAIALLVGYLVSKSAFGGLEIRWLGALLDPFGVSALESATRYWTAYDKNTRLLWFGEYVLASRLLWTSLAAGFVGWAIWRFQPFESGAARDAEEDESLDGPAGLQEAGLRGAGLREAGVQGTSSRDFESASLQPSRFTQLVRLTRRAIGGTVANRYFAAIALAGLALLVPSIHVAGEAFGTATHALTYQVLGVIGGVMPLYFYLVIAFGAGELVWRDREAQIADLVDATPTPTWVMYISKLLALVTLIAVLLTLSMVTGMLTQLIRGHADLEIGLYLSTVYGLYLPDLVLVAVLALFIHVVVNHKYLGHTVVALYYVAGMIRSSVGLEHNLWFYGSDAGLTYSDLNGFGAYLGAYLWFKLYWALAAVLVGVATHLLWVRGRDDAIGQRLRALRRRTRRAHLIAVSVAGVLFVGVGAWIFYNTNVQNDYLTHDDRLQQLADYEHRYGGALAYQPQPRIEAVSMDVALYPEERSFTSRGTYELANRTSSALEELQLHFPRLAVIDDVSVNGAAGEFEVDTLHNVYVYRFDEPLAPNKHLEVHFELHRNDRGFTNNIEPTRGGILVENGTFLMQWDMAPSVGLRFHELLSDKKRREELGLDRDPLPAPGAERLRSQNPVAANSGWIRFNATISTAADQTAMGPGKLVRSWEDKGRRHFEYADDGPMLGLWAVVSARYEVRRGRWNDIPIEVYFHPTHDYNVDAFIETTQTSLEAYTRRFGDYPYDVVRIVEFPRYTRSAMALPGIIPFSESIGFIASIDDDDIDYPTWVTAHEVAHMWWAHQVMPARTKGASVLTETLSQYASMTILEERHGPSAVDDFLVYELDQYLAGRSVMAEPEPPIERSDGDHQHLFYNKGALVMWRLQDLVGTDTVDAALRDLLERTGYSGSPYPTVDALTDALERALPRQHRPLVDELFGRVILHEFEARKASARRAGSGDTPPYEITFDFRARKLELDDQGHEHDAAFYDGEVANVIVYDADDEVIYREKHRLEAGENTVRLEVPGQPVQVEIGPAPLFLDGHTDDNSVAVTFDEPPQQ